MKIWRTSLAETPEARGDERRRHGRLKTADTESTLGQVVDISASGMRIVRKGSLPVQQGEKFRIDITIDQEVLAVDVVIRRVTKMGRRKFEFGIEFINLDDTGRRQLAYLARTAATSARAMW